MKRNNTGLPDSMLGSVVFLIAIVFPIVLLLTTVDLKLDAQVKHAEAKAVVAQNTPTPSPTPVQVGAEISEQEKIESYIRTIFGGDANVAIAVSRNECSPRNVQYPRCVYHTDYEYSVGIFQINLYNKSHWIHAKKVPGETMEEKVEWLKDPYHNTLIAFKIFTDSGFNPWSAYTNGAYLKDL